MQHLTGLFATILSVMPCRFIEKALLRFMSIGYKFMYVEKKYFDAFQLFVCLVSNSFMGFMFITKLLSIFAVDVERPSFIIV